MTCGCGKKKNQQNFLCEITLMPMIFFSDIFFQLCMKEYRSIFLGFWLTKSVLLIGSVCIIHILFNAMQVSNSLHENSHPPPYAMQFLVLVY